MEKRLEKALELGADGVINGKEEDVLEKAKELTDGMGFDLAIETAGTEITTNQAIQAVSKGATIVLVGYGKTGMMTVRASMAIEAVEQGKVNLKGIATHIFDFDDIQTAMDRSVNEKAEIVKAVVKIAK